MIDAGLMEYVLLFPNILGNLSFHQWFAQNQTTVVVFGIVFLVLLFLVFRT